MNAATGSTASGSLMLRPARPMHRVFAPAHGALRARAIARASSPAPSSAAQRAASTHAPDTVPGETSPAPYPSPAAAPPHSTLGLVEALQRGPGRALASALAAAILFGSGVAAPLPAAAVLNSPNARIPRSVDAALRRAIPAFNQDVRAVQGRLEDVAFQLRIPQRKPWQAMGDNVAAASAAVAQRDKALYGVPADKLPAAMRLVDDISDGLRSVNAAIDARDADKTSVRVAGVLRNVAELELLQAPGLPFSVPRDLACLPLLTGRAVVELTVERPNGSLSFMPADGSGPTATARLQLVLDGYSAPVTAGNFAANVRAGLYNGIPVNASYASVLAGAGRAPGRAVPLEILPAGDFDPLYKTQVDVASGELPALPLSIFGALAMAHLPPDAGPQLDGYMAADEFFIYKFSREQAGLSGLAFDEGQFGVFGYVSAGVEVVTQLQSGDIITSARLTAGEEHLSLHEGQC